ncbi:MAG: cell division protein FtsL [Gammaproteobacteria bacterium]|nr:cell division protein FtsL [Gammaproteobacteria bacterium]
MQARFPKPTHLNVFKWRGLFLFILIVILVISSVAVVRVQHEIRHLETRYYQSLKHALHAHEERGRLLLEKRYLMSPARVERVAKTQLDMTLDKSHFETVYIRAPSEVLGE